jgi:biotin transport system substrate-specific component
VPLSLATLAIYLAAASLGWKRGVVAVLLYVAIGAVGLPVFSNFAGGFHVIAGLTGGFVVGYIPCALATGFIVDVSSIASHLRKSPRSRRYAECIRYALSMAISTVLLYACGTAWFAILTGSTVAASLAICVLPFLIGDAIKIIIACLVAPKLRSALIRTGVKAGR